MQQIICDQCNREFTRSNGSHNWNMTHHQHKFCSLKCLGKFQSTRKQVVCKQCSKVFFKLPSEIKKTKNNFCSRSCAATYNNTRYPKREKVPKPSKARVPPEIETITKGELFARRKNWQSARSTIAKHARKVFLASLEPMVCCICGYSKHIEITHIRSVSSFDESALVSDINHICNLRALCPNHHWEADNLK